MPEILKTDAEFSEEDIIIRAVKILTDGGVIAYPSESF
jgi:tRNA A37 threonylcarbamoyladenosine synthetase subunit TsaC/SUA5/YrdC